MPTKKTAKTAAKKFKPHVSRMPAALPPVQADALYRSLKDLLVLGLLKDAKGDNPDVRRAKRAALKRLAKAGEMVAEAEDAQGHIDIARDSYTNDDLEIDPTPAVSRSDLGVWIAAWVHVSDEELEE
jgi:Asp-tRNA(Asn)/Glu-tRNA(Gln) amidotransferase A subunit family amidase